MRHKKSAESKKVSELGKKKSIHKKLKDFYCDANNWLYKILSKLGLEKRKDE